MLTLLERVLSAAIFSMAVIFYSLPIIKNRGEDPSDSAGRQFVVVGLSQEGGGVRRSVECPSSGVVGDLVSCLFDRAEVDCAEVDWRELLLERRLKSISGSLFVLPRKSMRTFVVVSEDRDEDGALKFVRFDLPVSCSAADLRRKVEERLGAVVAAKVFGKKRKLEHVMVGFG